MSDEVALKVAQQRLFAAYDPQRFHAAAGQWAELLSAHLAGVCDRQTRVLNWAEPEANIAEAERWLDGIKMAGASCAEVTPDDSASLTPSLFQEEREGNNDAFRFADIVRQM